MLYSPVIYCLMHNAKKICGQSLDMPSVTGNGSNEISEMKI